MEVYSFPHISNELKFLWVIVTEKNTDLVETKEPDQTCVLHKFTGAHLGTGRTSVGRK